MKYIQIESEKSSVLKDGKTLDMVLSLGKVQGKLHVLVVSRGDSGYADRTEAIKLVQQRLENAGVQRVCVSSCDLKQLLYTEELPFKLNWAAGYIVGAVGIIFSVAVCKILASKRFAFITEMSNATFVILCSHLLLLIIGSKLCSIILPDNTGDVKYWLNAFITTIAGGVLYIVLKKTQLYALIGYR